jgi:hypothetical protein
MIPGMKFDAYHCTIPAHPDEVQGEISRLYHLADFRPISGSTHGYERLAGWFLGSVELARMYWGGNGGGVSIQITGSGTPELVKRVRIIWPEHSVSRADVAFDVDYGGAWDELSGVALAIGRKHRLKRKEVRGHGDGDTIYVGSPASVIYCRVYQKGKELFGSWASPDHVRVEVEVKPGNSQAKRWAANMEPDEFFGAADWTRELAVHLGQIPPDRVKLGTMWRDPDTERARRALVNQYWRIITEWTDEVGGASELLRVMGEYASKEYGSAFDLVEP